MSMQISCADNQIHILKMPSLEIMNSISGIKVSSHACSIHVLVFWFIVLILFRMRWKVYDVGMQTCNTGHFIHYFILMSDIFIYLHNKLCRESIKNFFAKWSFTFHKRYCKNNGKADFLWSIDYVSLRVRVTWTKTCICWNLIQHLYSHFFFVFQPLLSSQEICESIYRQAAFDRTSGLVAVQTENYGIQFYSLFANRGLYEVIALR